MIVSEVGIEYPMQKTGILARTYEFSEITYDEWVELIMRGWPDHSPYVDDCFGQWSVGYLKGIDPPDNMAYFSSTGMFLNSWVVLRVDGEFSGEKIFALMARGM